MLRVRILGERDVVRNVELLGYQSRDAAVANVDGEWGHHHVLFRPCTQ
jgi:hypothetical protein